MKIILVGGTNGKGSTAALAESILQSAGYKTGLFSSPHFLKYTERIKINNREIAENEVIKNFELIESVRGQTKITFFEFSALSAMLSFVKHRVQVAILEVGMGGRLDATNIWPADVAIVTNIGLDHQKWLGETVEQISREKAGIFKKNKLAVIGEKYPPANLLQRAHEVKANLKILERDFSIIKNKTSWNLKFEDKSLSGLNFPNLAGEKQFINSACAIVAVLGLKLNIKKEHINQSLKSVQLAGRLQNIKYAERNWLLDVAHNPDSAKVLADYLNKTKPKGKTLGLFAMLDEKDIDKVIDIMQREIDIWCVLQLDTPRALSANIIKSKLNKIVSPKVNVYNNAPQAINKIIEFSKQHDRIVVFGSFYTVAAVMEIFTIDV